MNARHTDGIRLPLALLALSALTGCAIQPTGPSLAVLPGQGKSIEEFSVDDSACRAYAVRAAGVTSNEAGAQNLVASAAVGTAVGALAGAVVGGHNSVSTGAAIGLGGGTLYGTGLASDAQYGAQRRYDIAYGQCMYAKGNEVPRSGGRRRARTVVVREYGPVYDEYYDYPPAAVPPPY